MWKLPLLRWQQDLLGRLGRALGRKLNDADVRSVAWDPAAEALTVVTQPAARRAEGTEPHLQRLRDRQPGRGMNLERTETNVVQ